MSFPHSLIVNKNENGKKTRKNVLTLFMSFYFILSQLVKVFLTQLDKSHTICMFYSTIQYI